MNNVPSGIYERVRELAVAIVNASAAEDEALTAALTENLRAFYRQQADIGFFHPFLTEALADFTEDDAEAVRLYELALKQAHDFPGEPRHTKLISLADRLIRLGRAELAEAYLRDGRADAVRESDSSWVEEADRLLRLLESSCGS